MSWQSLLPALVVLVIPCGVAGLRAGAPEERIRRALEQRVELGFSQTPLTEVAWRIGDFAKIPIVLDKKAIEDVGVEPSTPITFSIKGVTLRSALRHMLRDQDLTWIIKHEVILITIAERADLHLERRIYDVRDLVAVRDEHLRPYNDFAPLRDLLANLTGLTLPEKYPTKWDWVGSPGSMATLEATGVAALVVNDSQDVHADVEHVLAELRKPRRHQADSQPPIRPRRKIVPQPKPKPSPVQSLGGGFF
jgi:hypothetical protein